MESSISPARRFMATGGKALMALAFASAISGMAMSPALARDEGHDGNNRNNDHRRYEWHGDRDGRGHRPEYRRPYAYAQPVYVPPPVYYEPRQSPGISLFLPLDLRR
ncbi:MAG: hypothetical protein PHY45_11195 [Rhodocyclaceae bacterium]|nr:hypothetical protein [Rhodocyclaceae bacterium]